MRIECPWCLEMFDVDEGTPLTDCPNCGEDIHAERDGTAEPPQDEPDYNAPTARERAELLPEQDKG